MSATAHIVHTAVESRLLNARRGPMVMISASGMATGGRVPHYLKAFGPDKRNTILFAGYQAGGTRGATIAGGPGVVRIFGEEMPVRAEVAMLGSLSAHADGAEIIGWLRHFNSAPRQTFIIQGEPAAAEAMRQRIERELHWNCHMPSYLETIMLD